MASRRASSWALLVGLWVWAAPAAGRPVYLIGLDGASWNVMGPLMEQGRLPNLSRLAAMGSSGTLLSSHPMLSPALWTTIATGVPREEHGITDFTVGRRRLTSKDRRAPAIWEILSASSRTVCLVGYMKTWPAEPVNGVMVSDLLFNKGARPQLTFPADALRGLDPLQAWDEDSPQSVRRLRRFIPFDWDPDYELAEDTAAYRRGLLVDRRLSWVYMRDESYVRLAERLLARRKPDFFAIHLWGIDFVSHGFWKYMEPAAPGVAESERGDFSAVIPRYYEYVDELVGRLLALAGDDADVLVVSDHGFEAWTAPQDVPESTSILSGNHAIEGVLLAAGPDIQRGATVKGASQLDLAPTMLYLLDAPIARTLKGRVLDKLLAVEPARRRPLRLVKSYPARSLIAPQEPGEPLGGKEFEMLRASGYLK